MITRRDSILSVVIELSWSKKREELVDLIERMTNFEKKMAINMIEESLQRK